MQAEHLSLIKNRLSKEEKQPQNVNWSQEHSNTEAKLPKAPHLPHSLTGLQVMHNCLCRELVRLNFNKQPHLVGLMSA